MIKVSLSGSEFIVPKKFFPCGELLVQLNTDLFPDQVEEIEIDFFYEDNDDIMLLLLVVDTINSEYYGDTDLILNIGYFPYGRQDRISNPGEPLSARVFANLVNSCEFDVVYIDDPHSDVAPALIDNSMVVDIVELFDRYVPRNLTYGEDYLVSPDAGANKKVGALSRSLRTPMIRADKVRDTMTGKISDIEVYCEDLTGKSVMIVDDICDGGGTFIGLAKKLREKGADSITLYVTHGMFTAGLSKIFEEIDFVICLDYYGDKDDPKLKDTIVLRNKI